jgi:hypothetical protein
MNYRVTGYLGAEFANIELTAKRFAEIKLARRDCLFAMELEEKLTLLASNYIELEVELLRQAQESVIWRYRSHNESMLRRLSLDRHLVNFLTACRLYLDQTDHGISALFGNPSSELAAIKAFKSKLYDDNWGYRFMEALRNHVQHAGLPVNTICNSCSRSSGKGQDFAEYCVIPKAQIRSLRENPEFKMAVLDELPGDQKEIDLREPAREYMSCLFQLHSQLRSQVAARVAAGRPIYMRAVNEYSNHEGQTVHFPTIISQDGDGPVVETVSLVTDFLTYYDDLKQRNTANENIRHSTTTNTTQKKA